MKWNTHLGPEGPGPGVPTDLGDTGTREALQPCLWTMQTVPIGKLFYFVWGQSLAKQKDGNLRFLPPQGKMFSCKSKPDLKENILILVQYVTI